MAKRVVITGGGTGLGLAIARRLAADGHEMFLLGRTGEKVKAAAATIGASRQARSTNPLYALKKYQRCCSGGRSTAAGMSVNICRSSGMSFATSGAASPISRRSASRGTMRAVCSVISTNGTKGGVPCIS